MFWKRRTSRMGMSLVTMCSFDILQNSTVLYCINCRSFMKKIDTYLTFTFQTKYRGLESSWAWLKAQTSGCGSSWFSPSTVGLGWAESWLGFFSTYSGRARDRYKYSLSLICRQFLFCEINSKFIPLLMESLKNYFILINYSEIYFLNRLIFLYFDFLPYFF